MAAYHTIPQDVLFFRDGRPMEAGSGSGGHGARWPEPSIIFDAVHAALHRAFPVPVEATRNAQSFQAYLQQKGWLWQHPHRYVPRPANGRPRDREPDEKLRNQRFGALRTAGPFPAIVRPNGTAAWLFPVPADFVPSDQERPFLAPLRDPCGSSDLPMPLEYPLGNPCEPSKAETLPWWTKAGIEAALRNEGPGPREMWAAEELYAAEWTTGIGIDPERQTQDGKRIYSAEYLRLREDTRLRQQTALGFAASLPLDRPDGDCREGMDKLFPAHDIILCGGQQRACRVQPTKGEVHLDTLFPVSQFDTLKPRTDGKWRLKWLLLSPAVYPFISKASPGGWLPNWISATDGVDHGRPFKPGAVLLKSEIPAKQKGESRNAWRKRLARDVKPIQARLVAARVPKPVVITGWTERLHEIAAETLESAAAPATQPGPRSTLLAVPAGAVYYFEADPDKDGGPGNAIALANALSWHGDWQAVDFGRTIRNRRSTLLGEKGYGLGVCGTWEFFEDVCGRPTKRKS